MNITEKKRAESMVEDWQNNKLAEIRNRPKPEIEKPAATDEKKFKDAIATLRELKQTYDFNSYYLTNGLGKGENLMLVSRESKSKNLKKYEDENDKLKVRPWMTRLA